MGSDLRESGDMLRALVWRWSRYGCPAQGIGIGLRRDLAEELTQTSRRLDLIEVMPENWICFGGKRQRQMLACLDRFPAVTHSIALNIGGLDPLDNRLLDGIASFCERHDVPFWSDHVCYSTVLGTPTFDLLPLPFTRQIIAHTAPRIRQAQATSGDRCCLKTRRSTPRCRHRRARRPPMSWTKPRSFASFSEANDCSMLLDVNNVCVNSRNHGFDPRAFIDRMPLSRVRQIHLAGHSDLGNVIIDTHIGPNYRSGLGSVRLYAAARRSPDPHHHRMGRRDSAAGSSDRRADRARRWPSASFATSAEPASQAGESPLARAS